MTDRDRPDDPGSPTEQTPAGDPWPTRDEDDPISPAPGIAPGQTSRSVRGALLRYRVMAYLVGTLLVVLVVVGLPLKYIWFDDTVVRLTGIPHGWLYMVLLITAYDLGRRAHWGWGRMILIGLAGTVPFLSFVAERSATKDVQAKLVTLDAAEAAVSDAEQR